MWFLVAAQKSINDVHFCNKKDVKYKSTGRYLDMLASNFRKNIT